MRLSDVKLLSKAALHANAQELGSTANAQELDRRRTNPTFCVVSSYKGAMSWTNNPSPEVGSQFKAGQAEIA